MRVRSVPLLATVVLALSHSPAGAQLGPEEIIVADRDADPAALGGNTGAIFRVDPDTGSVSTLASSTAFVDPMGVAIDSEGRIVVADRSADPTGLGGNTGAVFRFRPGEAPTPIGASAQFVDPWGVAIDAAGRILVTDSSVGDVFRFAPGEAPVSIATTLTMPAGIAVDTAGNVLVADRNAGAAQGGEVFRFAPGGLPAALPRTNLFSDPTGIAIDEGGRILVADPDSDPDGSGRFAGAVFRSVPGDPPAPVITGGPMGDPFDLAIDSQGRVLIADSAGGILRAAPGEPAAAFATSPLLQLPLGIAVSPAAAPSVDPPPEPPDGEDPPTADTIAPQLSSLSLSHDRLRHDAERALASGARKRTRVSYELSEPAAVRFKVQRRSGRQRLIKGGFEDAGEAGLNSFKFDGSLGRRELAIGRYRLLATATDPAGNVSPTERASFRVVAP